MTEKLIILPRKRIRHFHQLGLFILDGSPSMTSIGVGDGITKAEQVDKAMCGLLTRMKVSGIKENFSFSVVTFDTEPRLHTPITACEAISDNPGTYIPTANHNTGGTSIAAGLSYAKRGIEEFLASAPPDGVAYSVVVILMSDGENYDVHGRSDTGELNRKTVQYAQEIKDLGVRLNKQVELATTFFGTLDNTEDTEHRDLLKQLVSKPSYYKETHDARDLRNFFTATLTSTSGIQIQQS